MELWSSGALERLAPNTDHVPARPAATGNAAAAGSTVLQLTFSGAVQWKEDLSPPPPPPPPPLLLRSVQEERKEAERRRASSERRVSTSPRFVSF
ncbi:uncharacterized protein V6R79_017343 [Siganus canaliculatus]